MDSFAWPPRAGGGVPHLSTANGGTGDLFGNGLDTHGGLQQQQQQQLSFQHAGHLASGPASSSATSFSSGPSPYPSPLVPGERGSAAASSAFVNGGGGGPSVLPPVREDLPFTSPPLSSGGMASMADSRLGSAGGFRPSNGGGNSGFGDLVSSAFGPGSIGDIWGATSGLATPYDPSFSASGDNGGQTGPPPSTASLIAARPYTANAASALVFMSQSGSADGPHASVTPNGSLGPDAMGSPVFAADAMLQQVTQSGGGPYTELPPSAVLDQSYGRPGSSHAAATVTSFAQQLTPGGGRPLSAANDPQQFAYAAAAAYPPMTTRTSFAMENLSLQSLSSGGSEQAFASPYVSQQQQQQQQRVAPNYHQTPVQALQFGTAPSSTGRRASISQQSANRPTSQGGPDRRPLHQQQQNMQHATGSSFSNGSGLTFIPGFGGPQHGRSASLAHRAAHPYSRPAHNSMSAASTAATLSGWNGNIDSAGAEFAQLYQHQAGLRPQTSDGVPLSYYGAEWGVPAAAVFGPSTGIQPSSYAPTAMYTSNRGSAATASSRPSTSYAAQAPSMLDPPGSTRSRQQHPPTFAAPHELQPTLAAASRATEGSHSSIAPPSLAGIFNPPPPAVQPPPPSSAAQAPARRRANSAAISRTAAPPKPKPKAAVAPAAGGDSGPDGNDDDDDAPAEREISAVTGRPKRPRRKFEEVERNYVCNFEECGKAYGTLNHLNAHVLSQNHGQKRMPAEFRDLRKLWRRQRRERAAAEANKGGKGTAKGKRKAAAPAAFDKRRKSSADGAAPGDQEGTMNSASDDEVGAEHADHGRRESVVSQASTTGGAMRGEEDDDDDDATSADEDEDGPLAASTSTPGLNGATGAGGRRFSSPAFVSSGPTPPTFSGNGSSGTGSLGFPQQYYNLDIPSFGGGASGLNAQALPVAGSAPSPFADWSFNGSLSGGVSVSSAPTTYTPETSVKASGTGNGQSHPLHGATYLAPTPGLYDATSLDFGPGPPSEPSTSTAGTPRLGHY